MLNLMTFFRGPWLRALPERQVSASALASRSAMRNVLFDEILTALSIFLTALMHTWLGCRVTVRM
jgi:hypothetical protein